MRKSYQDNLDNNLTKMFNTNRDYINHEIRRLASVEQMSPQYRRSGAGQFGATQLVAFSGNSNYATIGETMTSTIVL